MSFHVLRDSLTSLHPDAPQVQRVIEHALADVWGALSRLSSLGHHYHLEEGPAPQVREWPRVMYHLEACRDGRVVNSHWDYEELGPGWYSSLAEAKYRAGLEAQFAGRGGVRVPNLPMVITVDESDFPTLPGGPSLGQRIRAERQAEASLGSQETLGEVSQQDSASLSSSEQSVDAPTPLGASKDSFSERPELQGGMS
jgi:hypothetical protein